MKILLHLIGILLPFASLHAQIIFSSTNLPHQVGDYSRAYYKTNADLAALLGDTNGPQIWDFAFAQQADETIFRTDIVLPNDGGNETSFPGATYAERDIEEPSTQIAWRYYSVTNEGRSYHGFYKPVDNPVTPLVVFDHPTLDIPASVQHGQTWSRSVNWTNVVLTTVLVAYHFTASAHVDGHGTLSLPGIGQISALRVREVHAYNADQYFLGSWIPFLSQTNIYYYWLTREIGVAAQIIEFGNNALFPVPLPHTNVVLRVFECNLATNQATLNPVEGLRLNCDNSMVRLNWNSALNSSGYQVEMNGNLNFTNWTLLGLPQTNSWWETLTATQRFYRVFWKP